MQCQSLFSGKKYNISKCCLLKFLSTMLSIMGNGLTANGNNSNREIFSSHLTGDYSYRKESAPFGGKFFPLRVAPIFERFQILRR